MPTSCFKISGSAWACAAVLSAGLLAGLPAHAESSTSISAVIAGKSLNLAYIDSYSSLDLRLAMTGRTNRLTAHQRSEGSTSLSAVMAGQANRADIALVAADTTALSLVQTSTLQGAATAKNVLVDGQTSNGEYVTIYQSDGFGYFSLTATPQQTGTLGRGH